MASLPSTVLVSELCLAWERVKALARPSRLYLPGHDLLACQRFPGPAGDITHLK